MSATTTRRKATKARRDIYAEVTDRVMEALETGTVPWHKPWNASGILPTSVATGRPYRGINVWLLSMTAQAQGYGSPYWLTFNQAKERGGSVRKGERGTLVVFWKLFDADRENAATGRTETVKIPILRHFTVFNLEQTDDVSLPPRFDLPEHVELDPHLGLEAVQAGYVDGPQVIHREQDRAYYEPTADRITIPMTYQYPSVDAFGSTLLHELAHSTGHASRLDRFAKTGEPQHFGSERYAREELLAEMGAAMLAVFAGIEPQTENSAAYIRSWLDALRGDSKLVVQAAQAAQKAVDRILGTTFDNDDKEAQG